MGRRETWRHFVKRLKSNFSGIDFILQRVDRKTVYGKLIGLYLHIYLYHTFLIKLILLFLRTIVILCVNCSSIESSTILTVKLIDCISLKGSIHEPIINTKG